MLSSNIVSRSGDLLLQILNHARMIQSAHTIGCSKCNIKVRATAHTERPLSAFEHYCSIYKSIDECPARTCSHVHSFNTQIMMLCMQEAQVIVQLYCFLSADDMDNAARIPL